MELLQTLITEATHWENQLTDFEKTEISYSEARQNVINRMYEKYKDSFLVTSEEVTANYEMILIEFKEFLKNKYHNAG